jgi:hypothetical protein
MPGTPVGDVIVLLPGITGSALQKDGKDVWALSGGAVVKGLSSRGSSIKTLKLHGDHPDVDDLGDGVTATRVLPDTHLIPGLWKIDGYGKVSDTIRREFDVQPGVNFFEFAYDWRRDNRVHARRLARESRQWLETWRDRSGNKDAKLVLIGHSMGGLICRYFLEVLEGWKDTRTLITFGTPYRGSLNAVDFIANGIKKSLGPVTLLNLTDVVRSFTSVYQLLPIYKCVDTGGGALARVTEVDGIPGLVAERAAQALDFHREIREAVEAHADDPEYREHGYVIRPIAGVFQPTNQSALLRNGGAEILRTYEGRDEGGDGTVPSVSATPIELSNLDREIYVGAPRIPPERRPRARPGDRAAAPPGHRSVPALRARKRHQPRARRRVPRDRAGDRARAAGGAVGDAGRGGRRCRHASTGGERPAIARVRRVARGAAGAADRGHLPADSPGTG